MTNSEWIDYKEAATLMHRPAAYLRARWKDGSYKYWANEIERFQPGGRGTQLFVRREHVQTWIERRRNPIQEKRNFNPTGYESALETMRRLGATGTMKSFKLA